jgi:UDP-2-acetamido-3-amino-2,3-dideoxy-glucuronate N-acetyltransferase
MVTPGTLTAPRHVRLRAFDDRDGLLTVAEFSGSGDLPFAPQRVFVVGRVPRGATRAGHAQRTGEQLLVAVHGRFVVDATTADATRTHVLDDPTDGLYVPAGNWITCRDFSCDAVMMVLASDAYDPGDQIEDPDEYHRFAGGDPAPEVAHAP